MISNGNHHTTCLQPGVSALDMALSHHQFPIAHLLISLQPQDSSNGTNHLLLAVMEGDADAVDFLLDVPLEEARALFATGVMVSQSTTASSSSPSSDVYVNAVLSCRSTDEICCRIITTLRRAGLRTDSASVITSSAISDSLSTLISQPITEFIQTQTRRIFEAVNSGSLNVLQQWLALGVDAATCVAADGATLLHACVSKDAHVLLRSVLSSCGDCSTVINNLSSAGITALHLASQLNRVSCVEVLLAHSADVNITSDQSSDGNTPLIVAVSHFSRHVYGVLLAAGADVFVANRIGLSVLHVAAAAGNTFALHSIISHVTSLSSPSSVLSFVNTTSLYGDTALHLCAFSCDVPIVKALKCSLLLLQVCGCVPLHFVPYDRHRLGHRLNSAIATANPLPK
jgi:ankyrin repeat protein